MTEAGIHVSFADDDYDTAGETYSIPAGTYPMVIAKAEVVPIKSGDNEGKDQLKIEFRIDAEGLEFTETVRGNKVTLRPHERPLFRNYNWLTDRGREYFLAFLKATKAIPKDELVKYGFVPGRGHVEKLQGARVAGAVTRKPEPNTEYALADGMRNDVARVFAIDSEQGKIALKAVRTKAGKDSLAP